MESQVLLDAPARSIARQRTELAGLVEPHGTGSGCNHDAKERSRPRSHSLKRGGAIALRFGPAIVTTTSGARATNSSASLRAKSALATYPAASVR
jgi:hypothetical protein